MKEKKLKYVLHVVRVIETVYLFTIFFVLYLRTLPHDAVQLFALIWLGASLMLLPLFILKNIIVALYNGGLLTNRQKMWLLVRCAVYILLAMLSYPLILTL